MLKPRRFSGTSYSFPASLTISLLIPVAEPSSCETTGPKDILGLCTVETSTASLVEKTAVVQNVAAQSDEKNPKEADIQPEVLSKTNPKKEGWLRRFFTTITEAFFVFCFFLSAGAGPEGTAVSGNGHKQA